MSKWNQIFYTPIDHIKNAYLIKQKVFLISLYNGC